MSENGNGIGAAVKRREDFRFLTGLGRYTDDINRPGQAFACFVRSPHARAKIKSINTAAAMKAPGVAAIYTGKDMAADKVGGLPCGWQIHSKDGSPMKEPPHMPLVESAVCHVGDQVAVVIAESVREAKDAAELVEVDYEVRTPVVGIKSALAAKELVHEDAPGNVCYDWELCTHEGGKAEVDAEFEKGGACGEGGHLQQPPDAQRDRAARRHRRIRRRRRQAHALHHQPESACHPPADGCACAAYSGA